MSNSMPPALSVSAVHQVSAAQDGSSVVVKAAVDTADGNSADMNITLAPEVAAKVAIALLEKSAEAHGGDDAAAPALDVLAAAVVPSDDDDKVRVKLLLEEGAVLPVDMAVDAGANLSRDLTAEISGRAQSA